MLLDVMWHFIINQNPATSQGGICRSKVDTLTQISKCRVIDMELRMPQSCEDSLQMSEQK